MSARRVRARFRMMSAERKAQPVGFRRESEGVRSPVKCSLNDFAKGGGGRDVMCDAMSRCSGVLVSEET